jgi:hypothetical protein
MNTSIDLDELDLDPLSLDWIENGTAAWLAAFDQERNDFSYLLMLDHAALINLAVSLYILNGIVSLEYEEVLTI